MEEREHPPKHLLADFDHKQRYEWLRLDCAACDLQRQAREDGLIATVVQISSAALLGLPTLLLAIRENFPSAGEAEKLYVGLAFFLASLLTAMLEQHFSSRAYAKQIDVLIEYYHLKSNDDAHKPSRLRAQTARYASYLFFVIGIMFSLFGIISIGANNG